MDDIAGVEQVDGGGEVVGVFEEKGAELGKEDGIALVDGELGLVGFDLTEVGVDRGVEDDGVLEDGLGVAAGGAFELTGRKVGIVGVEREKSVLVLGESVGVELEVARAGNALDAAKGALLGERAGDGRGYPGPVVGFGVARQVAAKHDAPVRSAGAKANGAKGNGKERHPAPAGDAGVGVPDLVVAVVLIGLVGPGGIGLHTGGVELKEGAAAVVLEGVQENKDVVVGGDVFATCQMAANQAGVGVKAEKNDVQGGGGVADVDLGALGGGLPIVGSDLGEAADVCQVVGKDRGGVHAFEVGEAQRRSQPGHGAVVQGQLRGRKCGGNGGGLTGFRGAADLGRRGEADRGAEHKGKKAAEGGGNVQT